MAGAKIALSSTSGELKTDGNDNARVNLPTSAAQAGYAQIVHVPPGSSIAKVARISEDGGQYSAEFRQLFFLTFNSASTNWFTKIGTNATTMTKATQNGFMRINNSAITTTTSGISWYTLRTFNIFPGAEWMISFQMKHANATATNKQAEFGLGYYGFAAGQAAQMNEFIGFRFKTDGTLAAVVATSAGGSPAETETTLAGFPGSDNVSREYRMTITDTSVEFWIDDVYQTRITRGTGVWGLLKSISLPFIARMFHNGTASAAATFDVNNLNVMRFGADDGLPYPFKQASMDAHTYSWEPDITTAATQTHNSPASGTAPTAATGSNTASVLNNTANLGGFFRMNGASIGATVHSIVWVSGYQNPVIQTSPGVASNSRNLYVTSITVSPLIVSTVLVGGGFSALWFASIGCTALTSATTDADGTTAVAQRADRIVPLSRHFTFGAAAAVGTLETGAGDTTISFPTPLVIHPGEFLKVGIRTTWVNAAVTSGVFDGSLGINGYWD